MARPSRRVVHHSREQPLTSRRRGVHRQRGSTTTPSGQRRSARIRNRQQGVTIGSGSRRFNFPDPPPLRRPNRGGDVIDVVGPDSPEGDGEPPEPEEPFGAIVPIGPLQDFGPFINEIIDSFEKDVTADGRRRLTFDEMVDLFNHLERGQAIQDSREYSFLGFSLRDVVRAIEASTCPREELYFTGTLFDFSIHPTATAGLRIGDPGGPDRWLVQFQLKKGFIGVPMVDIITDDLSLRPDSDSLSLTDYLYQYKRQLMDMYQTEGSDWRVFDSYWVSTDLRIRRMTPFPYGGQVTYRTGGFDRLLLRDFEKHVFQQQGQQPFTFFIPGSISRESNHLPNCIFQCIAWGLAQHDIRSTETSMGETLSLDDKKLLISDAIKETQVLYEAFSKEWFEEKMRVARLEQAQAEQSSSTTLDLRRSDIILRRKSSQLKRSWDRLIRHGLSNILLRRLDNFLRMRDIDFQILLYNKKDDEFVNIHQCRTTTTPWNRPFANVNPRREILCLQVNLAGEIQTTGILEPPTSEQILPNRPFDSYYEKEIFPGLLHSIALFPPELGLVLKRVGRISESPLYRIEEALRFHALRAAIDTPLCKQLRETFEKSKLQVFELGNDVKHLEEVILLQRIRMNKVMRIDGMLASTHYGAERVDEDEETIHEEVNPIDSPPRSRGIESRDIGIIAYDCETVENLRGVQDCVDPRYRTSIPESANNEILRSVLTSPQSQIPYTLQWGFVNMLDPISGNEKDILHQHRVIIERGGEEHFLGACVEDFLMHAYIQAISLGYKKVYCYAHNGSGFDTYMILHYIQSSQYFVHKRILVTPRGILNLEVIIKVGEHPKMTFFFRDTKLFFNASLRDLCTIFKVPSQFQKTDFPITRVHARNYRHPRLMAAVREYMENDIWSLAFIIRGINDIIKTHILPRGNPNVLSAHLPIIQNVTLMTLVTYLQRLEFARLYRSPPLAVDIPSLRNFIQYGNMGGRVLPFWRYYRSHYAPDILYLLAHGDGEIPRETRISRLKEIYTKMREGLNFGIVLDVTSLYPYVMSHYPMPTGLIKWVKEPDLFFNEIVYPTLNCVECHRLFTLCPSHLPGGVEELDQKLGFGFFLLNDLTPPHWDGREEHFFRFQNLCPRKKVGSITSLVYHYDDHEDLPKKNICYTYYDTYWLRKCGWSFTIVAAFSFDTTYTYREQLLAMFEKRKDAKRMEREQNLPKSLSTMWKNLYNGGYGINARQDIQRQYIVCNGDVTEQSLRANGKLNADEYIVRDANTHRLPNGQWLLKIQKHKDSAEFFAAQSPNHIGAAVTSTARHHMNLMMFNLPYGSYGYTDTDSVFITGTIWNRLQETHPHLLDERADAPMGTYKNDHEGPGENIVFLSMLLAKKVKLHMTINKNGEMHVHPTFKGFNPSRIEPATEKHFSNEYLELQRIVAMKDIFYEGKLLRVQHQTAWRRNMADGVRIDREKPFDIDPAVYWEHSSGSVLHTSPNGDFIEHLIPHGWWRRAGEEEEPEQQQQPSYPLGFMPFAEAIRAYHKGHPFASIFQQWLDRWEALDCPRYSREETSSEELQAFHRLFDELPILGPSDQTWPSA